MPIYWLGFRVPGSPHRHLEANLQHSPRPFLGFLGAALKSSSVFSDLFWAFSGIFQNNLGDSALFLRPLPDRLIVCEVSCFKSGASSLRQPNKTSRPILRSKNSLFSVRNGLVWATAYKQKCEAHFAGLAQKKGDGSETAHFLLEIAS